MNRPGGFVITERGLELCAWPPGARLLDVGCGTGASVRHLRQAHGFESFGVDRDPGLVRGHPHLACAHGEHLPIADGSLDGALLECSLSVMEDPDRVLRECFRILRPGGRILLSDVHARGRAAELRGCLGRVETLPVLLERLEGQGFRVEHVEDYSGHLRAFWAQRVFERGAGALCAELATDGERLRAIACGYVLLVARKGEP